MSKNYITFYNILIDCSIIVYIAYYTYLFRSIFENTFVAYKSKTYTSYFIFQDL